MAHSLFFSIKMFQPEETCYHFQSKGDTLIEGYFIGTIQITTFNRCKTRIYAVKAGHYFVKGLPLKRSTLSIIIHLS